MKIVDCFTFYNEIELLGYRLAVLDELVDYLVLKIIRNPEFKKVIWEFSPLNIQHANTEVAIVEQLEAHGGLRLSI